MLGSMEHLVNHISRIIEIVEFRSESANGIPRRWERCMRRLMGARLAEALEGRNAVSAHVRTRGGHRRFAHRPRSLPAGPAFGETPNAMSERHMREICQGGRPSRLHRRRQDRRSPIREVFDKTTPIFANRRLVPAMPGWVDTGPGLDLDDDFMVEVKIIPGTAPGTACAGGWATRAIAAGTDPFPGSAMPGIRSAGAASSG